MTVIAGGGGSSDGVKSGQSRKHALVIPLSFQAHVAGIYRHAVQLAERGVTVTFVSVAKDVQQLKTYDELQGLDFNLLSYDPSFTHPEKIQSIRDVEAFIDDSGKHFQPILADLKAKQKAGFPGPTCIIFDRFFSRWVKDAAKELNLPIYSFFSCGAILARFFQVAPGLFSDGTLVINEDTTLFEFEGSVTIPGLPNLRYCDLPFSSRQCPHLSVTMGKTLAESDAVIVNTFYELEYPHIDEMRRHFAEHSAGRKIPRLFLVGPVSNVKTFRDRSFASGIDNRGTDSLQWLDGREAQSVLYICLGSLFRWTPPVAFEVAQALEASEQSFLWVLPLSYSLPSLEEALPAGFEERTRGRGLIASGWVPQLQILAHSSVGGFLTHCGWNSIIESISSGVPMIAWPQNAEQFLNRKYFVEVLRIAVQVGHSIPGPCVVSHDELEEAVRLLMVEEEGKAMRTRVQDLQVKAKAAVEDGGSSQAAIRELVDFIPTGIVTD